MKRLIVLIFFPSITLCATAQSDSARSGNNTTDMPASIRIASNSSLIYPGAAFGLDYPVQYIQVTKYVKNGSLIKSTKQRFVSVTLGYYHHTGFHDNFYILPEWVMRKAKPGGWFMDFSTGLGYSRTFLGGTVYRVDDAGNVSIHKGAGYSYALIAAGLGLGYDFSAMKSYSLSLYSRMTMLVMFPYNSTFYPRPVFELGVIFKPGHFIHSRLKIIYKTKGAPQ